MVSGATAAWDILRILELLPKLLIVLIWMWYSSLALKSQKKKNQEAASNWSSIRVDEKNNSSGMASV